MIHTQILAAARGYGLGELVLDHPKALHALTLDMVDALQTQLDIWANDESVVAVFLDSTGDKAFCAGGDVVSLQKALSADPHADLPNAFFSREYRLNLTMHTYPKPIICWGSGIVMGGGMGLLSGASYRLVTQRSMLAMPEVSIGLYPDVAASWFLNRIPRHFAEFLAITAYRMSGADAVYLGLADRLLDVDQKPELLTKLLAADWRGCADDVICQILRSLENTAQLNQPSQLAEANQMIRSCMDAPSLVEKVVNLKHASELPDYSSVYQTLETASPLSMHLSLAQLTRCRHMSLEQVLDAELSLSLACCHMGEFAEGVRALLVDKDCAPSWQYAQVSDVPKDVLKGLLEFKMH